MRLKINPSARILHIPKELVEGGFTGEVKAYSDSSTLVIIHPKASLEEARMSLNTHAQAIQNEQIAEQRKKLAQIQHGGTANNDR